MSRYISVDILLSHKFKNDISCNAYHNLIKRDAHTVDAIELVRCKDCGFFEVNHFDKVAELDNMPLITAHNICRRWGNGCQTSPDGFCFMGISKKVTE